MRQTMTRCAEPTERHVPKNRRAIIQTNAWCRGSIQRLAVPLDADGQGNRGK